MKLPLKWKRASSPVTVTRRSQFTVTTARVREQLWDEGNQTHTHTQCSTNTQTNKHILWWQTTSCTVWRLTHTHTHSESCEVFFLFPFLQICEETQENNTLSLSFRRLSNYWLSEQNDCSYLLLLAALDYILYIKLLFFSFTFLVLFRFL